MEIARESIFVSSLRSFTRCFFAIFGIFLALLAISILYSIISPPKGFEEKTELNILPDLNGHREYLLSSSPALLRINIHGIIGELGMNAETIENILLNSHTAPLSGNRVKGILLHINTPGGTITDADNIYRMLKSYKETYKTPIYAYVDGMCASGGMYIASCADHIFASPPSVIGSIGVVIGPFFNVSKAMQSLGIESETLTQGIDKDMLNPFRTWRENEDASLRAILAFLYGQFVDIVTTNRPQVDRVKLIQEYGAQVFDGPKAAQIGYIDTPNATYSQALAALIEEAKIDPTKPYQVVELKPRHDWTALLSAQSPLFNGKVEHTHNLAGQKLRTTCDQFSYIYEPALN